MLDIQVSFPCFHAETSFLGQVIVPLAMIGKDQSCRLILPVLPTSTDNSYVTGQINLEVSDSLIVSNNHVQEQFRNNKIISILSVFGHQHV